MESFFGSNPWDFGTGFTQPPSFAPGSGSAPVMPQTDLTGGLAQAFASQGIRPDQFMANPQAAAQALQPTANPPGNAGSNPWDPTPVDVPGGPPVSLGGRTAENPNIQTNDAETPADASAAGEESDKMAAKTPAFGDRLAAGLKGVKMPTPPTPQKVSSPAAPKPEQLKGAELLSMILGMQPGQPGGMKPPLTLNNSLRGAFG